MSFDENGTIQRIYAFIYGKNEAGEKKTYLIDYDADSSNDMTVWIDGNVNGEYSDDMRLSPMIEILNNSDWTSQVEAWAETFEEQQIYEILYMGRRSFSSEEGLQYIFREMQMVMELKQEPAILLSLEAVEKSLGLRYLCIFLI